ncbi:MAG: N-acetylmuramoyl-L-alanine amidase family protein [Bacteroidota bacterium]
MAMPADTPVITNIRAVVASAPGRPAGVTLVELEADRPIERYALDGHGARRAVLRLPGARTRMPDGPIAVHDGLLVGLAVQSGPEGIAIALEMEHAPGMTVQKTPGFPARLTLSLARDPLWRIMRRRRLTVDPGHGGKDTGGRGPVNLLEKDMTLAVALKLAEALTDLGSVVTLTRDGDRLLGWRERCAMAAGSEAMVSLHTAWYRDPSVAGIGVRWLNPAGRPLAVRLHDALLRKLPLPDRGSAEGGPPAGLRLPVVAVEFATISNPVEEGWLRSSTFLRRAAVAVANGLKDYFAALDGVPAAG